VSSRCCSDFRRCSHTVCLRVGREGEKKLYRLYRTDIPPGGRTLIV
jgi:hypothetical protein